MLKLSLRSLRAHVGRYVLTFLAVAIGVSFIGGVLTLTDTISRTFHDLIADVNDGTDAWVQGIKQFESSQGFGGANERPRIAAGHAELIAEADGVTASEPYVQSFTRILDVEGEAHGDIGFGPPSFGAGWVETDELNPFDLTDGSRAPRGPDEIVLDKGTADSAGYEVGDTVHFQAPGGSGEATLVGMATFGTADSPLGATFVLFDQETAQELLAEPGMVHGIGVVAESGISQDEARDAVAALLDARLDPEERAEIEVITGDALIADSQAEADEQFGFIRNVLLVFAAISIAVGAFVIYTSFSFIVVQRQRQVALLRAIGATRRQTLWSVLVESLLVGVAASLIGYGAGLGLARLLSTLMVDDQADLVVSPSSAAIALGIGTAVTVASAFVPAWRGSRIPPVAAMRMVSVDRSDRSLGRAALSVAVLVAGVAAMVQGLADAGIVVVAIGIFLVFLGLVILGPLMARPVTMVVGRPLPVIRGVVGRLAQRNAERNPKRTAYTGSALMIGLGVVSLILVMYASVTRSVDHVVDNRFNGDFVVSSGMGWTGAGVPGDVTAELDALDEVAAASGLRFGTAEVEGSAHLVGGLDPATGFDLFDIGITEGDIADLDGDGVAVFDQEARAEGWTIGDEVTVRFAETGEHVFTVAVLLETKDITGTFIFSNEVFDVHLPDSGDSQIWVELAPGVEPDQAAPVLEEVIESAPVAELLDLDEFKSDTKAQMDPILVMLSVLLALTIVIAMIGIVNTLVLSVVERAQEIGLTRAVGGTRGQMRAMIRWEALLIAAFGLMAAIGVGIFFGWVIVQALEDEGFRVFDVPIASLAAVTALTGALTLLAAVLPAVWGARRPILPAIAAE